MSRAGNQDFSADVQESSAPPTKNISESTFQNLREKIEGDLKKSEAKGSKKNTKNTKKSELQPPKPIIPSESARGTKRSHNGVPKQDSQSQANKSRPTSSQVNDDVDLKSIIAELGGTEEDLDLIADADSDSELEGQPSQPAAKEPPNVKKGKTLESGMANILKEIALVRETHKDSDEEDEGPAPVKVNATERPVAVSSADKKDDDSMKFKSAATELQKNKGKKSTLCCPPRPDWFAQIAVILESEAQPKHAVSARSLDALHDYGKTLLQAENEAFKNTQGGSSSQSFYNTVIASGTLSDKISALTLAVQESPLHNMRALEALLGLAKKRSRSQSVDVLRALKDLLAQGSLLPGDRRLYTFTTHPGVLACIGQTGTWQEGERLPGGMKEADLIAWTFEDWLKEQYFEVLKVLETWCNDEIEFSKSRATSYVYELLKEKPEQEANLLRLLINKLGDPVKKIASQASYLIMQLLATHPAMKQIVVSSIDTDFIFKPGQSTHARYYATVTLNQTALSVNEENIAIKLLDIYFGLFKLLLRPGEESQKPKQVHSQTRHQRQRKQAASMPSTEQEDELREKLISAILTGVNRAYPYAGPDHQRFSEHIDTLFQITHSANFNTSIQAMLLIQQLIANTSAPSDRFYRTLYESLLDPRLITSSKQQLYLNLLHRSLKADLNQKRVKAFAKRILQVLTLQEPSFICGAFFLIKDLEKTFPSLTTLLDQHEDHDDDEEVFRDVEENTTQQQPIANTEKKDAIHNTTTYDPAKRDPAYANADTSCLWDVLPYLAHYHPSVSLSADHTLDHKAIPGKPDLTLHTLIHFLDRFIYKNAKLSAGAKMRGSSIMQPMANDDTKAVLVSSGAASRRLPVNSAEFLAKKEGDVAAEDVFFHQYFKTLGKAGAKKVKKAKRNVDEDGDEAGNDDDEDEVWQAMLKNGPDLDGLGDEDDEDLSDMEGFEDAMDDDDDDDDGDLEMDGEEGSSDIDVDMDMKGDDDDDDGSVDIEAGIFDDSDEEVASVEHDEDEASEFGGLSSGDEAQATKQPSKKTLQKKEDRERRRKLKALPTFAAASDYANALDDDDDEDLG